jgi:hypothetical protein
MFQWFPTVFSWFSHEFPWFSHDFPMNSLYFPRFSHEFPMISLYFPICFYQFPTQKAAPHPQVARRAMALGRVWTTSQRFPAAQEPKNLGICVCIYIWYLWIISWYLWYNYGYLWVLLIYIWLVVWNIFYFSIYWK